eukprot:151100-Chlamydomonas_euryale.AAC.2
MCCVNPLACIRCPRATAFPMRCMHAVLCSHAPMQASNAPVLPCKPRCLHPACKCPNIGNATPCMPTRTWQAHTPLLPQPCTCGRPAAHPLPQCRSPQCFSCNAMHALLYTSSSRTFAAAALHLWQAGGASQHGALPAAQLPMPRFWSRLSPSPVRAGGSAASAAPPLPSSRSPAAAVPIAAAAPAWLQHLPPLPQPSPPPSPPHAPDGCSEAVSGTAAGGPPWPPASSSSESSMSSSCAWHPLAAIPGFDTGR